jgi:hypothetical protein
MMMVSQIKKFGMTDYLIIGVVFMIGFVFSLILSSYRSRSQEKLTEISKQF